MLNFLRVNFLRDVLMTVLMVLVLGGCAGDTAGKGAGDAGGTGKDSALPQRIVSLAPSLTEALYELGGGDLLKGCTIYCNRPEEAREKEKIGTLIDFNVEKILSLRPDLVLAMEFSDSKTVDKLKQLGIRVERFRSPRDFESLCRAFVRLGRMVGREDTAVSVVDAAQKKVTAIRAGVKPTRKLKIFWQLGAKPLFAATGNYFTNDYIKFMGAENIAGDAANGIYSREEVLKKNPDVIVIITMGIASESEKQKWYTYDSLNAVKTNRIFIVDADTYCRPTPRSFAGALAQLKIMLYPDLTTDADGL